MKDFWVWCMISLVLSGGKYSGWCCCGILFLDSYLGIEEVLRVFIDLVCVM
jgi:hypothetical protein